MLLVLPVNSLDADTAGRALKAVVVPGSGSVGQAFEYSLSIAGKDLDGVKVELPPQGEVFPEDNKGDEKNTAKSEAGQEGERAVPLYIINNASMDEAESEGLRQISVKVQIAYYRPGTYQLPEISVTDTDGVKIGYSIPSVTIEELNREGKAEDIEPPLELSGNYTRLIIIILVLAAAALAVFLVFRYLKKRRKAAVKPLPQQSPLEFFMSEIERLHLRGCIESGNVHGYVFGISITFRRFLSMALGFDAAEMTTGEISSVMKRYIADSGGSRFAGEIVDFMDIWDLSKFAEFTLSKEVLTANLDSVISAAQKIQGLGRGNSGTV